jgi:NAD(P)H-dependent FMN reductase
MRIVTLCGSLRPGSTTGRALEMAASAAQATGASVEAVSLCDLGLPFCDGRKDESTYGASTAAFRSIIASADGLLIGSPNYHGSMTGALKNALDLLGPDAVRDKLVGLVATARGDAGAMNTLNHLRHVCRWMNAWVIPAEVSIPRAQDAFDGDGNAVRDGLSGQLATLGTELVRYAGLMRAS